MTKKLAIHGGTPVRRRDSWPVWPTYNQAASDYLIDTLRSQRWTIRGWYTGKPSKQTAFAQRFAEFNQVGFCVPTASGSASLSLALEALDIGAHDEVIVPVYTWFATAVAVVNVNALPVFVDAHPLTGCIDPSKIEDAITSRTRAILPVHLHCSIADMKRITQIANRHHLAVVEDCAQAHGARLHNQRVGSFGQIGAFSMNQEKVLSCGEGGAITTNDQQIYDRVFRLCVDGSRLKREAPAIGEYEIDDIPGLLGSNYCMSDFQAAVLLAQVEDLEEQNHHRRENAEYLTEYLLRTVDGLIPVESTEGTTERTYFKFAIRRHRDAFAGIPTSDLCTALSAELGFPIEQTECVPLHLNPLFCPETKRRHHLNDAYLIRLGEIKGESYPVATEHYQSTIVFHHRILLGTRRDMDDIVEGFDKVTRLASNLG